MYVFKYSDSDFTDHVVSPLGSEQELSQVCQWSRHSPDDILCNRLDYNWTKFDTELRDRWDVAMQEGHFRYQLCHVQTRILPGDKKYIAQLNIKRATERRKPQLVSDMNQAFQTDLFNFTKVKEGEILFQLERISETTAKNVHTKGQSEQVTENDSREDTKKIAVNLIIINASPLEYGNNLLVPDIYSCRTQILTEDGINLALETMLLSRHSGYRVGFNSLCACASVNHQHFHGYYLDYNLHVEHCAVRHVKDDLYESNDEPVPGFAFQLFGAKRNNLVRTIFTLSSYLQQNEIAHNLFITRGVVFGDSKGSKQTTVRIYLWPRKHFTGVKDTEAFNVAVVELSGHLPIKHSDAFDTMSQTEADETLRKFALSKDEYESIRLKVMHATS